MWWNLLTQTDPFWIPGCWALGPRTGSMDLNLCGILIHPTFHWVPWFPRLGIFSSMDGPCESLRLVSVEVSTWAGSTTDWQAVAWVLVLWIDLTSLQFSLLIIPRVLHVLPYLSSRNLGVRICMCSLFHSHRRKYGTHPKVTYFSCSMFCFTILAGVNA